MGRDSPGSQIISALFLEVIAILVMLLPLTSHSLARLAKSLLPKSLKLIFIPTSRKEREYHEENQLVGLRDLHSSVGGIVKNCSEKGWELVCERSPVAEHDELFFFFHQPFSSFFHHLCLKYVYTKPKWFHSMLIFFRNWLLQVTTFLPPRGTCFLHFVLWRKVSHIYYFRFL